MYYVDSNSFLCGAGWKFYLTCALLTTSGASFLADNFAVVSPSECINISNKAKQIAKVDSKVFLGFASSPGLFNMNFIQMYYVAWFEILS